MITRALEMARENNRVFATWRTSLQPVLFLVHSDTIKHVMKTAEPKATKMKFDYHLVRPWLGKLNIRYTVKVRPVQVISFSSLSLIYTYCYLLSNEFHAVY